MAAHGGECERATLMLRMLKVEDMEAEVLLARLAALKPTISQQAAYVPSLPTLLD